MVEPGGEVVAGHQIGDDCGGVIAEDLRKAGGREDVRQRAAVADAVEHLAVQLGQRRLKAGNGLGSKRIGQGRVAVDEQAGLQAGDEGEGFKQTLG